MIFPRDRINQIIGGGLLSFCCFMLLSHCGNEETVPCETSTPTLSPSSDKLPLATLNEPYEALFVLDSPSILTLTLSLSLVINLSQ